MTFEQWLRKQKERNDPIGDLAKDWIQTGCPKPFTLRELSKYNPCLEAINTYHKAINRYLEQIENDYIQS